MKVINEEIDLNPDLQTDINFLNMTREEQHTQWWKIIFAAYNNPRLHDVHFR